MSYDDAEWGDVGRWHGFKLLAGLSVVFTASVSIDIGVVWFVIHTVRLIWAKS